MHATPAKTLRKRIPFYIAQASILCLYRVLLPTFIAPQPPCRSRAGPPSNLGVAVSANVSTFELQATQGMPKRKNFNRRALSCTSTRTHLEGRRAVELRNLLFKPCPRKLRAGVSGALWRLPIGTDVVPHIFFCFQMCKSLHELMKNGDAEIFPLYYSLKTYSSWYSQKCIAAV